ncbi:hypothetical protein dqs_2022 [Azoarcus olearius]|uniref:zonular occludens toxin family protein n=1 Tax=Azoarcus sp. (strain BH72) TaxID=418699 RepID=UPI000806172B|nr:zonular occludens toxin domain-containing protein [Azoarcus olearius]ANQ85060.1 hypothetical protein dqs_2022 [Azoarcus olearius]
MITLITGTPGAGKTAYAIAQLYEFVQSEKARAERTGEPPRPVFVMGVPDLMIEHEVAPPVSQWATLVPSEEDPELEEAVFTFPDGALVFIDEAQKVYRPRASGSKVPPHVAAFEKHRHKGLDFWLVTQSETLIDKNVRELVGKHIHLRSMWSGRKLYEWPETTDASSRTNRDAATTRSYKLPKHVFGLYKSASLHVKQSRRMPWQLGLVVGALGLVAWLGSNAYSRVTDAIGGNVAPPQVEQYPKAKSQESSSVTRSTVQGTGVGAVTPADFEPRIRTRPETAPIYDPIRQVKAMPVVAGCVSMRDQCKCYTQQGTDAFIEPAACRELIRNPPFNPWHDPGHSTATAPGTPAGPSNASLLAAVE